MSWYEILIIIAIAAFVIGVFAWRIVKGKKGGGCDCGCGGCSSTSCPSKTKTKNAK